MISLKKLIWAGTLLFSVSSFAGSKQSPQVEPPYWWTGMNEHSLQLLVSNPNIRNYKPEINYSGIAIDSVVRLDSPNYQFIYLNVSNNAKPGHFDIVFKEGKKTIKLPYELKSRPTKEFTPFSSEDVLYLIMPDRFSDGDTTNNNVKKLHNQSVVDRSNPNARHGGDIKGIENHLDYIDSLGVTAIWLNPVLENDMPDGSYHGYAITDFYNVDPRFGSNSTYKSMIGKAHKKGLKVVMDMIFNHTGVEHKWLKDMPCKDWYNHTDGDVMTNFRLSTANDPYVSDYDHDRTVNGWFVPVMPDLNQKNPYLLKYLIQNSIWWIESAQIDGIRMDTHPYADFEGMSKWLAAIDKEYPGYNVVGECWYGDVPGTAYWQKNSRLNKNGNSNLSVVMDFPTMIIAPKAFNDSTSRLTGLNGIYDRLSQDYLYEDVQKVLTFLENHDTDRFFSGDAKDLGAWKQAVAFILTTRGIPQLYYGQELLMSGNKDVTDGNVRKDVPGGFYGDKVNEFTKEGRSDIQNEAWNFISKIANWRRGNEAVTKGKLKHFMPENGLYVYERSYNGKRAIIMMNGNEKPVTVDTSIYKEILPEGIKLKDVISGDYITITSQMTFPARALYILE